SPALLSKVTADIQLHNISLIYQPRDLNFTNCSGSVSVSENNIKVDSLRCDMKQNHFEIDVAGTNINGISTSDPGKAYIACNVFTPSLNLDDFKTIFTRRKYKSGRKAKSKLAATAEKIDDMLEKGDLQLNIKANHVQLKHFTADNVLAQVLFQENDWEIQKASLLHAGGSLSVTGKIHEVNDNYHQASAKMKMQNVDVRKVFYGFDNFGQDGITYHNLRGNMNANADLIFGINSNARILPGSIQGTVDFSIKNGALIKFLPVEKIQNFAFLNRDLSNIAFAELTNKLSIKDNDVQIPRMEIASTAITMYVEGVYGYNKKSTDISMQIPISNLKRQDPSYKPANKGANAKVGMSIYLRAKSDETGKIKIGLELFKKRNKNKDNRNSK
ncbi:MAG TPA: AsmA-like C-terminal region-containing protein, partial [Chitinophagaceae bacterium]|nr:AsmA-like C-terminal region-containing protein [Chitinophagaceae bacterium]